MPRASKTASAKKAGTKKATAKKAAVKKKAAGKAASKRPATKGAATKGAVTRGAAKKAVVKKAAPAKKKAAKKPATKSARPAGGSRAAAPPPRKAARAHDAKFVAEQRTMLLTERDDYERQAEAFREEAEQLAAEMGPGDSQFDEETGGEGDAMSIERERDLAMSAQARAAIDEIDRALAKMASGTYGICERCHQPIPKPRLKALPYASLCVQCKSGGLSSRR